MCNVKTQILILELHKYTTYVIEVFGLLFNFVVVYFLLTDKRSIVYSYKITVIIHCIMDIGLGIMHILGMFQIESVGTTIFMVLDGPIQFINNYLVHNWSFIIANFFFSCSIFCGSMTVIYRYLIVVKKKSFDNVNILMLFTPIIVISGVIASQYIPYYSPLSKEKYKEYKKLLNNEVWARNKVYGENFIVLISPAYQQSNSFFTYFSLISYFVTAFIIIIFTILLRIHLKKNRSNMSESTLKIERQIQITLLIQALFPIFLGYIPNIIPFFMAIYKTPLQCYIIFIGICITYIPLINPCILLLMTPHFRNRIFFCVWKKNKSVNIKTITQIK
uniref:G-protein coupled receptors family 1 profile domain-containing protein n=1 Tax=Strongyloides stercoralis TaxID=6248 RepID=A0A0K0E9N4_STRER